MFREEPKVLAGRIPSGDPSSVTLHLIRPQLGLSNGLRRATYLQRPEPDD